MTTSTIASISFASMEKEQGRGCTGFSFSPYPPRRYQSTPREDFRAQPFQRLQNERQSALVVIFAVVNFSVYAPDHHLGTHDKVSLHSEQYFAKLRLRASFARK